MNLHQLGRTERGVTPVVGIILLVAIAVILASVVAVFALGIGDQTGPSPTAQFGFDYDSTAGTVTITHNSGENIAATEVFVRGDSGSGGESLGNSWDSTSWDQGAGDTSTTLGGQSAIASGDSLVIVVGPEYDVDVVWQSPEGDRSSTLAEDRGPDA